MLEHLQRHAVRICFDRGRDVSDIMEENLIETLEARRTGRCDKFILKAAQNPRFTGKWFPMRQNVDHNLRRRIAVREELATSSRRFNSPLFFLRRRANELGIGQVEEQVVGRTQ